MSFPVSLDEISERDLRDEIKRRVDLRIRGLCDYCGKSPDTPPCKFPNRHQRDLPLLKIIGDALGTDQKIQESQKQHFENGSLPSI